MEFVKTDKRQILTDVKNMEESGKEFTETRPKELRDPTFQLKPAKGALSQPIPQTIQIRKFYVCFSGTSKELPFAIIDGVIITDEIVVKSDKLKVIIKLENRMNKPLSGVYFMHFNSGGFDVDIGRDDIKINNIDLNSQSGIGVFAHSNGCKILIPMRRV